MNKCIFTGRTTREAELRYTSGDASTAIANTSLAVDDGWGDKLKTYFFELTLFGKRAEAFAKLVPKGTKIVVEGRAIQSQWEDKSGNKRSKVSFIVNDWEFAQSKGTASAPANVATVDADGFMDVDSSIEEELPFN